MPSDHTLDPRKRGGGAWGRALERRLWEQTTAPSSPAPQQEVGPAPHPGTGLGSDAPRRGGDPWVPPHLSRPLGRALLHQVGLRPVVPAGWPWAYLPMVLRDRCLLCKWVSARVGMELFPEVHNPLAGAPPSATWRSLCQGGEDGAFARAPETQLFLPRGHSVPVLTHGDTELWGHCPPVCPRLCCGPPGAGRQCVGLSVRAQ